MIRAHVRARWSGALRTLAAGLFAWAWLAVPFADGAQEWWERETVMGENGRLRLDERPWWPRAQALAPGEQFVLTSEFEGGGTMLVRRDENGDIVWIIDDDGDMDPADPRPDSDSDCYVADYEGDGTVDRLLDYIDVDGDGTPDEMDIRYFRDGELRFNWLSIDVDGDGHMWHVDRYEYGRPFFLSDAYGDAMIFMNKYDPERHAWVPISECPFAFIDDDGDGYSERVVRYSAVPLAALDHLDEPDYANRYTVFYGPFIEEMREMGAANVRYSFDVDAMSGPDAPLHYEMGFNMIGRQPYVYEGMEQFRPQRREPKTVIVTPFQTAFANAETYPAEATGFSFMEYEDGSLAIGDPQLTPEHDRRWEGVFWIWSRRLMHNTGGPTQFWNTRREYRPTFSDRREIYFSPVDRRLHLKGATEGWLRVGWLHHEGPLGEWRMFDTDANGYFDRWEYYVHGEPEPYRVVRVPDAQNIDLGSNWAAVGEFYRSALPEAIRLNERFIAAVEAFGGDWVAPVPEHLQAALEAAQSPTERRYVLDLVREHLWRHFRRQVLAAGWSFFDAQRTIHHTINEQTKESERVWDVQLALTRIDDLHARGRLDEAAQMLESLQHHLQSPYPAQDHN